MQTKKYLSIKAAPLVSIITLNWNQTETTCEFLESTRSINYQNYEVLVCDMGSAIDPSAQIYAGNYANTRLIKADAYTQFNGKGGIQWAINQAKGDFILLISNNSVVNENIVDDLLAPFLTDSRLGVTCPKVRSFDNPDTIEYAGYKGVNILTGRNDIIGRQKTDKGQFDTGTYTQGAYSGAMMIKKNIVDESDLLPPNFFIYFDDADLSARIIKKGYKIFYQPKAVVYSKNNLATGRKTPMQVYYSTRNRISFMRRNTSMLQFSVFVTVFTLLGIPATSFNFLVRRQFNHLKSFFKGISWHFRKTPVIY